MLFWRSLFALSVVVALSLVASGGCGSGEALPMTASPADDPVELETKTMEVPDP